MIRRLLLKDISFGQICLYVLASFVGLTIVACAVKFYTDALSSLTSTDGDNPLLSESYIVISKPISVLNSFGSPPTFSPYDIQEIKQQPWAEDAAGFQAADFSVVANVDFAGRGFSTHMFLEAIPDDFIDTLPPGWDYDPGSGECLPVIISKDYLTLYNFGFATARGLPQVTPAMLSQVPLNITCSGPGGTITLCAHIAGFSSRLNTIAVPMSFMHYANALLSPGSHPEPSRLIIRVSDIGDPAITAFLQDHRYDTASGGATGSRAASLLRVLAAIIISVGAIISILALAIILLSLNLLIQKNRVTISTLLMLGFTPGMISRRYITLVSSLNIFVALAAIGTMLAASALWCKLLSPFNIAPASSPGAILTIAAITTLLTAIHAFTITRHIRHIFYN